MIQLLETAQADQTGAIITGAMVFLFLVGLLGLVAIFGSGRPHAKSE